MGQDHWADADPAVPLLLLPIRLETRSLHEVGGVWKLRVRIYPDEVAVDDLERTLTEPERTAGDAYWREVWPLDRPEGAADPWARLQALVGARRAPWVAAARTPRNLADRGSGVDPVPPDDPAADGRPPGAWARLLPDAFRVVVRQGGVVSTAVTEPVDPKGVLLGSADAGLEGLAAAAAALGAGTDDPDADAPRWLADYDLAVAAGMAVTVELGGGAADVDRLLVLGVRTSDDPEAAAAEIGALLASHAVGDGLAFLEPGTPTNNTPASRAAWGRTSSAAGAPSTDPLTLPEGSAGRALADALGVDAAVLAGVDGATTGGPAWAAAFATALWPVTWDAFLDRSFSAVVGPRGRERLRGHAEQHVRGRGPLPGLRVGRQPYGVLPVTSFDALQTGSALESRLLDVLRRARPHWQAGVASVPTVMAGDLDTSLPAVLGQGPVSRSVRVRRTLADTPTTRAASRALAMQDAETAARLATLGVEWVLGLEPGTAQVEAFGSRTAAVGLPLADDSDPEFLAALVEPGAPRPEQRSVLQVLLALAVERVRSEVESLSGQERWARASALLDSSGRDLVGAEAADRGLRALQAMGEGRWDDPSVFAAAVDVLDKAGQPWSSDSFARRHPVPTMRPNPLDVVRTASDGILAANVLIDAGARYARLLDAIRVVASVPTTAQRGWLLGETLDCASHRLDAWITSLASARLRTVRGARPTGLVVGAYGWLENLRLAPPTLSADPPEGVDGDVFEVPGRAGAVHAPSPRHAATAAVLRGARLAHDPGDASAAALDIDLSSTRVRGALDLVDGLRAGQPLGALLGYRLERWLHETPPVGGKRLDRYVYVLRAVAPLVAGKVTDRVPGPGEVPSTMESVAVSDVVDGLRLLQQMKAGLDLKTRLSTAPPGFARYGAGPWAPADDDEVAAVRLAIERLERLHDALADLLLSEGVHQLVAGDAARSSAAMDALAGDAAPPEPDVVATPRSGVTITHKLLVLLANGTAAAAGGWARRPRAVADPELERWLRDALGPATAVALDHDGAAVTATLADAQIAAIELVAATGAVPAVAGDPQSALLGFWRRLRSALPDLREEPLVERPAWLAPDVLTLGEAWALAGSLRLVVAGARPLTGADLVRPGDIGALGPGADTAAAVRAVDLAELRARVARVLGLLEAVPLAVPAGRAGRLALVRRLARFGIGSPADVLAMGPDDLAAYLTNLTAEAARRAAAARAAYDAVPPDPAPDPPLEPDDPDPERVRQGIVQALTGVVATVFGDGLPTLPLLLPSPGDAFAKAWAAKRPAPSPATSVRPWLSRLARVRPGVARHLETLVLRSALGRAPALRVVQQPAGALTTWVGEPVDLRPLPPEVGTLVGAVVETGAGVRPGRRLSGLVVDTWVETLPRARAGDRTDVRTTGVAVHANGPDARAPQALLLAVSPDGEPWSWERVVDVLDETRALARLRLVTLEQVPLAGRVLPAAYEQDWSLQGEPAIDPRLLSEFADVRGTMRHVREKA